MWNESKVRLIGKIIILNSYIRKYERSKIIKVNFHLRKLSEEQIQSRRKEVIGIKRNENRNQ